MIKEDAGKGTRREYYTKKTEFFNEIMEKLGRKI